MQQKIFYMYFQFQVQEFNRDLSICVLTTFTRLLSTKVDKQLIGKAGVKDPNGITILEALSATGLRSIRYAKEVIGIQQISANDLSLQAVEAIKLNVLNNKVENLITGMFHEFF